MNKQGCGKGEGFSKEKGEQQAIQKLGKHHEKKTADSFGRLWQRALLLLAKQPTRGEAKCRD